METTQQTKLIEILTSTNIKQDKIAKVEKLIERKIAGKTTFLLDQALELAAGIFITKEDDPLHIKYYRKPPDLTAIIYLIDRLVGKPVAKTENKNIQANKGIAAVQNIIMNLAAGSSINVNKDGNESTEQIIDVRSSEDTLQE